jgi:outer membrane receptor protein involved in Fe transport
MTTLPRKALLSCGAAVGVLAFATGAFAQQRAFDIAAQPATQAVPEFARQAGVQIMSAGADLRGVRLQAVKGEYDVHAALSMMLAGTGLGIESDNGGVIVLTKVDRDPQSGSAAGGGAEVEALIVTAQKREEDIQDVPIAISAFSQEDLTTHQIAGGPDLITQVPNMTFTKTNFSSYSIQLRGIGTQAISATTDPAVAVAFNNTPFIRNRFFEQEFYDLQRVEVLRGPQGTLYGRNATAGVVNIISQKPKFLAEAKLSGDVSNFNSSRLEGMLNIPLVEDKVALRIAGAWTKRDGYATNELSGEPIDGRDLWSTRVSMRVTPNDRIDANLIWEHFEEDDDRLRSGKQLCRKDVVTNVGGVPITNYLDRSTSGGQSAIYAGVQATLSQGCKRNSLYDQNSFQRPNGLMLPYYNPLGAIGLPIALIDPYVTDFEIVNGFLDPALVDAALDQPQDLRVIQSTVDPHYRAENDLGELQISFDLSDTLTLSSETSYAIDSVYSLQDFNRFNTAPGAWRQARPNERQGVLLPGPNGGIFCDPQLGCSDRLMAVDVSTAEGWQFSQELRLASDFDGPFNFSLGANYLRADSEDKYYVFINSISLIAAYGMALFNNPTPYVGGQTDNNECLPFGYLPGDPNWSYSVNGCTYMDPNPIESVNDEGHNYFLSKNPYKLISYAVFGEAYYNITDNLKVTAGLRWTVDKKDAPRVPTWILVSSTVGYPVAEVIEQEWREPTGRLTIDWKPDLAFTDETLLYASYAHGYKAGGANPPGFVQSFYSDQSIADSQATASATRPRTFDPEFVDAFELGAKNTILDGRATLNLAAFYYDYKDYQISEIVDRSAFNRNFDATVWGVELEADWRPLENLRLGFKGGYQKTRIADGEQAIDLMDRTAGDPNWTLVRPFPTYASSCILPTYGIVNPNGTINQVGGVGGGNPGGCELAYTLGQDPWNAPYPGYPGFDPSTAPNNGEGIMKPLGGNELPNAPNWTGTITADYTIPLPNEWLATLHTDLHWQAESYWRIFQDHEYATLDEYFTMNLAAIFTNEERGWNIMAYIKNVTDETAITGAFLNSDDTGLTTNVFLTEPRLYGLRVTKAWSGGPLLGSFGANKEGPYPFTLEMGGQLQRVDAPNEDLRPVFGEEFDGPLAVLPQAQSEDLDWGNGGSVKLSYRPQNGPWTLAAGVRYGRTNGSNKPSATEQTAPVCFFGGDYEGLCEDKYEDPFWGPFTRFSETNQADATAYDREAHKIVDFMVGQDIAIGALSRSNVSAGLRYVELESLTKATLRGIPDWNIPAGFALPGGMASRTLYRATLTADREFNGFGPQFSWDAGYELMDFAETGRLSLDWSVGGGVLFGEQQVNFDNWQEQRVFDETIIQIVAWSGVQPAVPVITELTTPAVTRTEDATAGNVEASVGLLYNVGGFSVGAGYRWERYFDAIDGGFEEHRSEDRTIDGPYFKIAVGFGG